MQVIKRDSSKEKFDINKIISVYGNRRNKVK